MTELTSLHTETLNEFRLQRTLANITRRAETLFQDGYSYQAVTPGLYAVISPKNDVYTIRLSDTPTHEVFGDSCSCPAWEKFGECKHHLALLTTVRDEEQAAHYDALHGTPDDDRYSEL